MSRQFSIFSGVSIVICVLLSLETSASGGDLSKPPGSTTFNVTGMTVVIHSGSGKEHHAFNAGWHMLDEPEQLNCTSSSGCTIVALSTITSTFGLGVTKVCMFVDNVPAKPLCNFGVSYSVPFITEEYKSVPAGMHTIKTKIYAQGGQLDAWIVQYTLYEH